MIEVENLSKRYGTKLAVDGLSFVVQPGMVTGFLGPNGAGKSTTMRMIAGLDKPTGGRVIVNGGDYRSAAAPMAELGVLLEAKAVHTGRSARNHLLALAQTNGISRKRVDQVIDIVGLQQVAGKRVGGFSLGMGQRLGVASALLGNPQTVVLDEPVNGLDPEGVLWMRTMLKDLAADGHTVFVSSHLMSEMAQTATRLVVVGRGRLIADTTVDGVHRPGVPPRRHRPHSGGRPTRGSSSLGPDTTVHHPHNPDVLEIDGLTAEHIGTIAWQNHIPIFELTVQQASLEEAFMTLTSDSVEYRSTDTTGTATTTTRRWRHDHHPGTRHDVTTISGGTGLRVTQARVLLSEWTKFRSLRSTVVHLADRHRVDDRSGRDVRGHHREPSPPGSSPVRPRFPPH